MEVLKFISGIDKPGTALIQPIEGREREGIEGEIEMISRMSRGIPFAMYTFTVDDWNADLSPWQAPPVFGREPFAGRAAQTLGFVKDALIPRIKSELGEVRLVIGGYSLAGLFSLWAAYECDAFDGAASASGSLWYPGWTEYAKERAPHAKTVYLSLGDREENAKNPVMAQVGDATRGEYARLCRIDGVQAFLEWNEGNHFRDAELRTAKGFARVLQNL